MSKLTASVVAGDYGFYFYYTLSSAVPEATAAKVYVLRPNGLSREVTAEILLPDVVRVPVVATDGAGDLALDLAGTYKMQVLVSGTGFSLRTRTLSVRAENSIEA